MKLIKWKPSLKDEQDKLIFEGYVTLEMLPPKERMKLISNIQIEVKDGEAVLSDKHLAQFQKMEDLCRTQVRDFELTHIETQVKITAWEDLEYSAEYMQFIGTCGNAILSGVKLGEIYAAS